MVDRPCCSNIAELLAKLGTACLSSIAPLKTQHDGGSNRKQQPRPDGHLDLCGAHHMLGSHCRTLGNKKPESWSTAHLVADTGAVIRRSIRDRAKVE